MNIIEITGMLFFFGNLGVFTWKIWNIIQLSNQKEEHTKLTPEKQVFISIAGWGFSLISFVFVLSTLGYYVSGSDIGLMLSMTLLLRITQWVMYINWFLMIFEILLILPMNTVRKKGKPIKRKSINKEIF